MIKRHIRMYVLTGIFSVALLTSMVLPALAATDGNQAANGFRISPIRSELTIEKGKKQTLAISVENPTNIATRVKAVVNDFVAGDDETGQPRLILDDKTPAPKNDFRKLVGETPEIDLGPNQRKSVNFTVSVPNDATAGGYYGAIRFVPANNDNSSNVGLVASVGSLVLVTVPGNLTEKMDLVQLSAGQKDKPKSFIMNGNVQIITRLHNSGDIHVKPFGRVEVKNMFGKTVNTFELNSTQPRANVLPDTTRKFVNDVSNKKWFGRYTIEANIGYQQGSGNILTAKSTFWYVPKWALIVLAVLLLAIAAGVYLLIRKYRGGSSHRARK